MMVAGRFSKNPRTNATSADGKIPGASRWGSVSAVVFVVAAATVLVRAQDGEGFRTVGVVAMAVGWAGLWTLGTLGAGLPVVRWLVPASARNHQQGMVLSAIAGAGVLTACAGGLSAVGLFRPGPLMILLWLWALVGALRLARVSGEAPSIQSRVLPLVGMAGVALLIAATVSPFYDQWHQHLGFAWIWLQDGSIHPLQRNWYSFMPVNSSLLYAYGLKILGPWSAQVIHWWAGVVTVLTVASLTRKLGSDSAVLWTLWIVVATPTALHLATTAGNDLVVTMFCAGAWLGLIHTVGETENRLRWWLFAGGCVGLAMGTKYTAMGTVAIPLAVGAIVLHRPWKGADQFTGLLRGSSAATAAALAIFAPWAVRNFADSGNPLFPFLNNLFRATLKVSLDSAQEFDAWISGFDLSARHLVSGLDLGTFQAPLDGFPSIGLAYLPLAALAIVVFFLNRYRQKEVNALAAGALAGIAFWLASLHVDRYLLAALVPAIPVLAIALSGTLEKASKVVRFALVALMALVFCWNLAASASRMGLDRLGCTLGVEEVEPILARWVSSSAAFEPVAALPPDAKVLLVAEARALGFERPVELEHPFGEPRLEELARTSASPREMAETLASEGITHILANRWEADRIARMRSRRTYFTPADPLTAARLDQFARECLQPMWDDRGVFLYRLVPECNVPPPGAGGLARW
jgi:hypothetical protein